MPLPLPSFIFRNQDGLAADEGVEQAVCRRLGQVAREQELRTPQTKSTEFHTVWFGGNKMQTNEQQY